MKDANQIPLIYHPTNVLMIDDDIKFLKSMKGLIGIDTPYVLESDPNKALDHLSKHSYCKNSIPSLVTQANLDYLGGIDSAEHFSVDFTKLSEKMDTPDRFSKVVIAFVDQQMPIMDGLDFCRKVREKGLQVKLVLLTGNAGLDQAVSAFNEKIIDAYISKGRADLGKCINFYIKNESWKQFVDLGNHLPGLLPNVIKQLTNEKFSELFHKIWGDQQKGEFYLVDSSSSFLFFNHDGDATFLLVRNPDDFKEALEMAENSEASEKVIDGLKNCKSFPLTSQKNGYIKLQGAEWDEIMTEMKPVPNVKDLYYASVEKSSIPTFSFDRYFSEVWAKKAK